MAKKKTIVICSSGSFYKHVNEIASELRAMGWRVVVPATAEEMKLRNDYDVSKVKPWINDSNFFKLKHKVAMAHFKEIIKGDVVLIVNDDKPKKPFYVGANTAMEWGLAYYLGKPIFILNGVPRKHNTYEEVYGMSTAVLDGDLGKIEL